MTTHPLHAGSVFAFGFAVTGCVHHKRTSTFLPEFVVQPSRLQGVGGQLDRLIAIPCAAKRPHIDTLTQARSNWVVFRVHHEFLKRPFITHQVVK